MVTLGVLKKSFDCLQFVVFAHSLFQPALAPFRRIWSVVAGSEMFAICSEACSVSAL